MFIICEFIKKIKSESLLIIVNWKGHKYTVDTADSQIPHHIGWKKICTDSISYGEREKVCEQHGYDLICIWYEMSFTSISNMMMLWYGNAFHMIDPLWGEFTGHRMVPLLKGSNAKLCFFTRGQFWPSGIVVACVCLSVCPSVCAVTTCLSAR